MTGAQKKSSRKAAARPAARPYTRPPTNRSTKPSRRATAAREALSHLDTQGRASMVNVGPKQPTARVALAMAAVHLGAAAVRAVRDHRVAKGNVFEVARLAGITAAKRTSELIPLCHNLPLDHVAVDLTLRGSWLEIRARASAFARTGVEMEALTAASVAALTVYDMLKALDKGIMIGPVCLLEKSGGKSGVYRRGGEPRG
jgi:cyclic pyranopterin monophosphate synthase